MPGYLGGEFHIVGTKVINANPANPARGLERASGVTLLFDPETARIKCIMEASVISALRTAAVSMLSIDLLSCPDVLCICIIGLGVIGTTHLRFAVRRLPSLERAILIDASSTKAETVADEIRRTENCPAEIDCSANLEAAVRSADVVVTATTVTVGYIPYCWLKPGAVVVNVSLDDLLTDVFLNADLLFVDDWSLVCADNRRMLGRLHHEGKIAGPGEQRTASNVRKIDGELADLVLNRHPGRRSAEEIAVVNPFGMAIQDVALASLIFEAALRRSVGVYLDA